MAASGEKPYRVYRGGRQKGRCRSPGGREREPPRQSERRAASAAAVRPSAASRAAAQALEWRRWIARRLVLVLLVVWAVAGYFSVRGGVARRERAPADGRRRRAAQAERAAAEQLDEHPAARHRPLEERAAGPQLRPALRLDDAAAHRPDAASARRTSRSRATCARRSPGYGDVEDQRGDADRRRRSSRSRRSASFTGPADQPRRDRRLRRVRSLIDAVGGIDVNVPEPILSNRFDCPYQDAARCRQWQGWRFRKGVQHMDGHRALIYSRIRENRLNPARHRHHPRRAPAAGDAGDAEQARERRHVLPAAVQRQQAARSRSRPTSRRASSCSSAGSSSAPGTTLHCRLGGSDLGDGYITVREEHRR